MDDVDDQAVGGGPEGQRPCGHQQGHHVEQVGQVGGDVQGVVEGQHEHVAGQDGDVVPHQVLLQRGRRRQARLVYDLTHPTDDLPQRRTQLSRHGGKQTRSQQAAVTETRSHRAGLQADDFSHDGFPTFHYVIYIWCYMSVIETHFILREEYHINHARLKL